MRTITRNTQENLDEILYPDEPDRYTVGERGLLGTWEVARYLGVEKSRIARWLGEIRGGSTPIAPPVAILKSTSLWRIEDVHAKLLDMYAQAKYPYGNTQEGLKRWITERRKRRAKIEGRA